MKLFYTSLILAAVMFIGCNDGNDSHRTVQPVYPVQPVEPVQPIEPDPVEPEEPASPSVGFGTVNYLPSCMNGYATVKYTYQSSTDIEDDRFMIVHSVNNRNAETEYATASENGSVRVMTKDVYIAPNLDDVQRIHQIEISYVGNGIHRLDSYAFSQPACEVVVPVEPEPIEPEPTPEPDQPIGPVTPYAPNTAYDVGDRVTVVDNLGVTRAYICNTAYVSGYQGTWAQFRRELGNWTRIAQITSIKVKIQ